MGIQEDVSAKDYSSARNLEFVCDQWYLESVWETIILFYIFMMKKNDLFRNFHEPGSVGKDF